MNQLQKISTQKGDFLIESLVGMLLLSFICLGTASLAITSSQSVAQSKEGAIIVAQLKNTLLTVDPTDICDKDYSIYIPSKKENLTIKSNNCEKAKVKLTHYENGSTGKISVDLTGLNLEYFNPSIAIGVNGYSINGYVASN